MSPANTKLVFRGKKWSTIRPLSYLRRFAEGEVVRLGKADRSVRIQEIKPIDLKALNREVLLSEGGFRSGADLLRALKRFYPSLTSESRVVLIRFVPV
jgi:hypothetical protein